MEAPSIQVEIPSIPTLEGWFRSARAEVDGTLSRVLEQVHELPTDDRWCRALEMTREYTARPGKRLRPAMLLAGYGLADGVGDLPDGLYQFAAGVEILHTFMLVHDDIADGAETRRGGPALHRALRPGKKGEDLAVVLGDYLFARAIEVMLGSGLDRAVEVTQYYLGICREAAVGQYLDLDLAGVRLSEVNLFQILRVARLKTAEPSFTAPLVAGAMLAGGDADLIDTLTRVGRHMGVAFQLRDDVLGLFGESRVAGKPCDCDLVAGKRTYPVIAAYTRAPEDAKCEFDELWSCGQTHNGSLKWAQRLVTRYGGLAATDRAVDRASRIARGALRCFPPDNHFRQLLDELINLLTHRDY